MVKQREKNKNKDKPLPVPLPKNNQNVTEQNLKEVRRQQNIQSSCNGTVKKENSK